jgi:hypothetical protein
MAMQDEFMVTLPSDSNLETDPKNSQANYTVRLRTPIHLGGSVVSGDPGWEAALLNVQYTNMGFTFAETACIRFLFDSPILPRAQYGGQYLYVSLPAAQDATEEQYINELQSNSALLKRIPNYDNIDRNILVARSMGRIDGFSKYASYYKVILPRKHYESIRGLCDYICEQFNAAFRTPRGTAMQYSIAENTGIITFSLSQRDAKIAMLLENKYLAAVLGFATTNVINTNVVGEAFAMLGIGMSGVTRPKLSDAKSLYIYTDVTNYQAVGNADAPLLGIAPIQGTLGERQHWTFNPLCYLGVNKTDISSITILICDEKGERVQFPPGSDNVVCCLRFRKRKRI